ncbi:helix-turn-helix domain-containing protein [Burkholderia sp. Bp9031]|uniref:GlxA family transcriptional regulator n=1 Tax=Burkholderia sp. Bp9031 TaxID=2184566 RepID=UPI000F5F4463|nr:helix-turn-helix domain-containing protein [Burkholderia sp. Bp9031]RQZ12430.1 helix-turn-helix domain-containing protein [Burkholderia sp. Bp9031]
MHIGILVLPHHRSSDVAAPMDALSVFRGDSASDPYSFELVGTTAGAIRGTSGVALIPDSTTTGSPPSFDTLLVAGTDDSAEPQTHPGLIEWIATAARSARRIGAMGSSVHLLAHAGLLDGRIVAVHPAAGPGFSQLWPSVNANTMHALVRDGNILTAVGGQAGLDLALELVADDFGVPAAKQLAEQLQTCRHRCGPWRLPACLRVGMRWCIREIQAYVQTNLTADLSVGALAARAGMSDRNFARVFLRETGVTPSQFVRNERVAMAIQLLSQPAYSMVQVAQLCGFAETAALRRSVTARLGVTPRTLKARSIRERR